MADLDADLGEDTADWYLVRQRGECPGCEREAEGLEGTIQGSGADAMFVPLKTARCDECKREENHGS